jgi:hypothetical protein
MTDQAAWSLPSESLRVRQLLYLAEGLILGAGGLLLALGFVGTYLVDVRTGSFDPHVTPFGAFTLLFFLFLALRWKSIRAVSPPSPENPAPVKDWRETREWKWVVTVTLPVSGVLVGGAKLLWSWWEIVFLLNFDLFLLGTVLVGMLLYVYVLHKMEM